MMTKMMRIIAVTLILSILMSTAVMADEAAVLYNNEYSYTVGQTEARKMGVLLNEFRMSQEAWYWNEDNSTKTTCTDLGELVYDYDLEKIAMQRAAEIVRKFSHERPSGLQRGTIFEEYGYGPWVMHGENIAFGFGSAEDAIKAFREEESNYDGQGHRRNMLSDAYNRVGIGHVVYKNTHYWVQEFATSEHESEYTEPVEGRKTFIIQEKKQAVKAPVVAEGITDDAIVVSVLEGTECGVDGRQYDIEYAGRCIYTGGKIKAPIRLMDSTGEPLIPGKDYKVSYKNNKLANMSFNNGNYTRTAQKNPEIIIKFIKEYKKSKIISVKFDIYPAEADSVVVTPKASTITVKADKKVKFVKNAMYTAPNAKKAKKLSSKDMDMYMVNKATGQRYTVAESAAAPAGIYEILAVGKGNFCGENKKVTFNLVRE